MNTFHLSNNTGGIRTVESPKYVKGINRAKDKDLKWVTYYPGLAVWRSLAIEWLKQEVSHCIKLRALTCFFEGYLIRHRLPLEPGVFLLNNTPVPAFYDAMGLHSAVGISYNNSIHDFLNFVLLAHFSMPGEDGRPVISPEYHNPVPVRTKGGKIKVKVGRRGVDKTFAWIGRDYPQFEAWRALCEAWIKGEPRVTNRLLALGVFIEKFLIKHNLPANPEVFLARGTLLPDFYTACEHSMVAPYGHLIHLFLQWVLLRDFSSPGDDGLPVILPGYHNPVPSHSKRLVKTRRADRELSWVKRYYPQLEVWRALCAEWIKGEPRGISHRLSAFIASLEGYIIKYNLPTDPAVFLARDALLPDFYSTCPNSSGTRSVNQIHAFLEWVLFSKFSFPDDNGRPVISPKYRNPIARRSSSGVPQLDESVYSPLPYGYIDELRKMLVEGPNFRDWHWAQNALGRNVTLDWFSATNDMLDLNDVDCVWRKRTMSTGEVRLEMWSPVRWVALLVKLTLPLRTFQVRVLDSGEADTWRYEDGIWTRNTHPLAIGGERRGTQQGVFRRTQSPEDGESTLLYINTNKTADIKKSGAGKGYVMPWILNAPLDRNVFYWMEKLRNWQEKYNPITRRTSWRELAARHTEVKSDVQLSGYSDTCFLFRLLEVPASERHLPMTGSSLKRPWFELLRALEQRLAARGETHGNGSPIRFIPPPKRRNHGLTTLFPLHSLRVSLITALALEGQVPFPVLQKLVGHSRLLMTIYYTKPGASRIRETLAGAAARLDSAKEASIQNFLQDTEHSQLLEEAVCNSTESLAVAIPQHPSARNPSGWMPMHHGLCLVGGNTSKEGMDNSVGGCFNGGPNVGSIDNPQYTPVPGGSRNCVRCRWFVTEPHHLPALVAHFNNLSYHRDEASNVCLAHENTLHELKKQKAQAEEDGRPFVGIGEFRKVERVWETAMNRFSDLVEDQVACYRLMERCMAVLEAREGKGTQLIVAGTASDVSLAFEETESELLQLLVVCQDAEVYRDLDPGKAVFRRSQLLDAARCQAGLPPVFMRLSEKDQLLAGNAYIQKMAERMDPANPALGQRKIVQLLDKGVGLDQILGIDIDSLPPATVSSDHPSTAKRLLN